MANDLVQAEHISTPTLVAMSSAEIDMQITTARRFPRVITQFREAVGAMATLNPEIAAECTYVLPPRDGKEIQGPSARFAEIIASAWGNSRFGARIVGDDGRFLTAQGYFHDLQTNVAVQFEVRRPIVTKRGFRYSDDMIAVTGNAAASIALRNAVLKGIPKAFWGDLWERSRKIAGGDERSLAARRIEALRIFQTYGVTETQIFQFLNVRGIEDITIDQLATLRGIVTAFKDGDTTPEEVFAPKTKPIAAIEKKESIGASVDALLARSKELESAPVVQSPSMQDADKGRTVTAAPAGELAPDGESPATPTSQWIAFERGRAAALAGASRSLPKDTNYHYKSNKELSDAFFRGYDEVHGEQQVMP